MAEITSRSISPSYNVPNTLTLLRIALAGVIAWLLFMHTANGTIAAGIILVIASLTDTLDGLAARRLGQSTLFGSLFVYAQPPAGYTRRGVRESRYFHDA